MERIPNSGYTPERKLDSGLWQVTCRLNDAYPDGSRVDDPDLTAPVFWRTLPAEHGLVRFELAGFATPAAPKVWFVNVDEPRASPKATNLVAFANDRMPAGTILSRYQFATLGVSNDEQAGAVRWYPANGLVHQIFVATAWRRRQLATHLLYAAGAFHQANGWPGHLHGDGRRTELGERLVAGLRHPGRFQSLTETMPTMDA
jgi:hypothetical protein